MSVTRLSGLLVSLLVAAASWSHWAMAVGEQPVRGGYDVHEWSVLADYGGDTNFFATSRPRSSMLGGAGQ